MINLNIPAKFMKSKSCSASVIARVAMMFVLLATMTKASAQTVMSSYLQTKATSTYSTITGTTAIASGYTAGTAAVSVPLGFTFNFNGTGYTSCFVHPSGYITFGAASDAANYTPLSTYSAGVTGVVAALATNSLVGSADILYTTTGSAPKRTFVVQWSSARVSAMTTNSMNFQIVLYESTNKVQVVYGSRTVGTGSGTTQVGIGSSSSDFLNWKATNTSTTNALGGIAGTNWVALMPANANNAT